MPLGLAAAVPAIISAFGSAAGGAIGAAGSGADREAQRRLIESILKDYGNLSVPELQKVLGEQLGSSAQEGVRGEMDPRLKNEQMDVLDSLKRLEAQGGENAETRAVLSRIMGDVGRQEASGRNAIMDNMRQRGVAGGGAELAALLSNNQAAAERSNQAGLEQSSQANRRLLDTIQSRGQLSGQMRGQDYRELSDAAQAKDLISRYNADSTTRAKYYNAQLPAQQYDLELRKLAGKSNAATGAANSYGASAAATQDGWNKIGTGAGAAGGQFASDYLKSEEDKKKTGGSI